ncbi:hypothetical protein CK203_063102 [Vitis vinifera]|uniref:Uncharacterized protein n=1 Tax=Vitis vinifera TaxID=29760 RepID=A0A438G5M4_VITVI|nr:hypothetical protein CK203_063102 [Vitis vinifera]
MELGCVDSSNLFSHKVKARHMVTQNKRRYQEGGFDLGMTYITEKIVVIRKTHGLDSNVVNMLNIGKILRCERANAAPNHPVSLLVKQMEDEIDEANQVKDVEMEGINESVLDIDGPEVQNEL